MILEHTLLTQDPPAQDPSVQTPSTQSQDDDRPVLVLSPSVGQHADMWEPQLPAFTAWFRVLQLEHRGHAGKVPDGPYTFDELGQDVLDTLDSLGIQRFSFCGLSLGGMLGMWVAAHAPDRVERLAMSCTSAHMPPPEGWLTRAATVRAEGMTAVADAVVARWFTPGFVARQPEVVAAARESLLRTPAEGYAACCEALAEMDLRASLGAIRAPTLIIAGAEDPSTPPSHAEAIAAGVSGARLAIVPDAAHLATVEQPAACTRLLLEHLAREQDPGREGS
jgi:3-oxoadipate enol-lactonase